MKQNIKETYVFMLITGKTLEENHNCINTPKSNVQTGGQGHLFLVIKLAVNLKTNANTHTDGKNKNITLITIN